MSWSVEFLPFVPWPVLWGIAGVGAVLLPLLFWRSRRGAVLRLLSFSLLLLAVANPHLKQEDREPLNDVLAVVVDDSQSQAIAGRTARTDEVRKSLEDKLKSIPNLDVRWVHSNSTSADSERDGTMLFTDLAQALSDVPPDRLAGVIMITDGEVHDVPASAAALGFDAPVHALLTGKEGEFDRRLQVTTAPRFGIVGSSQNVEVKVTETTPSANPAPVKLTISQQGGAPTVKSVHIGEKVQIPVAIDHAGPNIVEIEAEAAPGELTTVNNRVVLTVEGVRENLRVLLVSGEPHAGERTWRNMLKSDASVDLVHFTILRPPEKQDGTPINQLSLIAFPTRELFQEKLDQFDLIIFDRYQRRGVLPLLYLENVARYVERGGAVLVSAGDDYASPLSLYRTPLGEILPAVPSGRVVEEPFKPKLTDLGEKHPVTTELPGSNGDKEPSWGRWFRVVDADPRDAEVLMKGAQDSPLLVIGQRGQGRVGMILSDHAWLWARGYEGGGPYTDLLRRLAHWLMKEPDLEEETLKATSRGQTLSIERHSIKDEIEPVTITAPSGKEDTVTLDKGEHGLWRKSMTVSEQGIYRVASGKLASVVTVGNANARELAAVTATDKVLSPLLEETGGGSFWLGRNDAEAKEIPRLVMLRGGHVMHGDDWLGLHKRDAYHVKGVRLFPLFTGFLALGLLLGLLAATWFREGH